MYNEAYQCFKLVIELPHIEIHQMQIEAAKKLILINQLLHKDKDMQDDDIKSILSSNPFQAVYMMMCRNYAKDKRMTEFGWIDSNFEEFEKSGNVGLAKQLVEQK